jgi:hypothetical protein
MWSGDLKVTEKSPAEGIAATLEHKLPHSGKIKRLPPDLRAEFDRRLIAGAFSDYRGLARWLRGNGYSISHASLARYGKALDRKLAALKLATQQARAVVEAAGGADDTINEGLMRLVQGDLFRVLVELKETDTDKVDVNALARNVASICRSSVVMRRAAEEMRNGIGRRVLAAERKVVAAARKGSQGGLSAAAEKRIRAALLEIAEMPVMAADYDEASLAAHRLAAGAVGERSSAEESASIKTALPEREDVGEKSGETRDE